MFGLGEKVKNKDKRNIRKWYDYIKVKKCFFINYIKK